MKRVPQIVAILGLLAVPALAQDGGIKYEIGGGVVSVFGEPDAEVQPTLFLSADMPLLPRTRLVAELSLVSAPGDTPDFGTVNFKSLETRGSVYTKLYDSGDVVTSFQCSAGFTTLDIFGSDPAPAETQHFLRKYGCGPRVEDGNGFVLSAEYGRDQVAGVFRRGQAMVNAKVPIPKTDGIAKLYFKSTLNLLGKDPNQRDYILFGVVAAR